jgi:hypothetical protein
MKLGAFSIVAVFTAAALAISTSEVIAQEKTLEAV